MTAARECRTAEAAIQRALVGASVGEAELDQALAHIAECEGCGPRFELRGAAAWREEEEDMQEPAHSAAAGERVEPQELFERALVTALAEEDATTRRRAAERLGGFERLGAPALAVLADAAAADDDERVRAAALVALDRLDEAVSIPQRVIDSWSAAPAEAAPFIAGVLARLAGEGPVASEDVTRLEATLGPGEGQLELRGKEGITGRLDEQESELWLRLNRLPGGLEKTMPVVALPGALIHGAPPLEWEGKEPGLVASAAPVEGGKLSVRLGRSPTRGGESQTLFGEIYLLSPKQRRSAPDPAARRD